MTNKPVLTKQEILDTDNWDLTGHSRLVEEYIWKHTNMENDNYFFSMKRTTNDGHTVIMEEGSREDNKLFEGYIYTVDDLTDTVRLLRLNWDEYEIQR